VPSNELTYTGLPIAAVPIMEPVRALHVVLAYRADEPMTAKARAFATIAREVVTEGTRETSGRR
jgi:DNA-binding transcriptional LysR family regulator